jgi:TPR repeat protein
MTRQAWLTDAKACPVDLMPSNLQLGLGAELDCEGSNIAGCLARCRRHEVEACYWLAQELLVKKQHEASDVLFQRACLLGEASGCTNRAASMRRAQSGDGEVLSCTARSFQKTCEAGDPWGCTMYGSALHRGEGVARDDAAAIGFYDRACELTDTDADRSCEAARKYSQEIQDESLAQEDPR